MNVKLLLSPLTKGAYFADAVQVARAEYLAHFPGREVAEEWVGPLVFLNADADEADFEQILRLSCVQALFTDHDGALTAIDKVSGFEFPAALVWGAKYPGKTNELVTQLAINVGLAFLKTKDRSPKSLLDPMAGRGTTLLWALRYGLDARGIELDPKALAALQRHVKKQTKLHRIKHKQTEGGVGSFSRKSHGRFLQYQMGQRTLRLITGDACEAEALLQRKRSHLIVADLPYGVQHSDAGGARNPLKTLRACAPVWRDCLRSGGAMVLIFNTYQPRRSELVRTFVEAGLQEQLFTAPHRMSESIVRDLVVFTKP
jgi:hypothetical protein